MLLQLLFIVIQVIPFFKHLLFTLLMIIFFYNYDFFYLNDLRYLLKPLITFITF